MSSLIQFIISTRQVKTNQDEKEHLASRVAHSCNLINTVIRWQTPAQPHTHSQTQEFDSAPNLTAPIPLLFYLEVSHSNFVKMAM